MLKLAGGQCLAPVRERHLEPGLAGQGDARRPACRQALSAAAAATSTLRLGSYVLAAPLRTPGEVAWETASLDVLSEGRFELGLGAGRPAAESDAARLGLPFGTLAGRVSRAQQTIEAVRARYAASDAASGNDTVRGVQQPRPPVLVAGAGSNSTSTSP